MQILPVAAAWAVENLSPQRVLRTIGLASLLSENNPIFSELGPRLSKDAVILSQSAANFSQKTARWVENYQVPDISIVVDVATVDDAQKTVQWVYDNDRPWIVYNGGHGSTTGLGAVRDGIQIDMRRLNKVVVAEDGKTATIGAGASIHDVVRTLHAQGKQTVTGICECVGFSGALLGGGHGWLQGQYGLMIDQLLEAELILPNGTSIRVSDDSHEDLFWAVKGAGHNFGLFTEYKYKVYDVDPEHTWASETYLFTEDKLEEVFKLANDMIPDQPANVVHWTYWVKTPIDPVHPTIMYMILYDGPASELSEYAKPIRDVGPAHFEAGERTMPELAGITLMGLNNTACAKGMTALRWPNVLHRYSIPDLRAAYNDFDELVNTHPQFNGSVYLLEGYSTQAVKTVPSDSTAFPHRNEELLFSSVIIYPPDAKLDPIALGYGRRMQQRFLRGSDDPARLKEYVNYADGTKALETVYGWEPWRLEKLRRLKRVYDPMNVMRYYNPII